MAVNLASAWGAPVQLLDCDVEEPNAHLSYGEILREETVHVPVPSVDAARCDGCGKCSDFCAYGAIVAPGGTAMVFPELCHGCGGCELVCPQRAIREVGHRIGTVETRQAGMVTLVQGAHRRRRHHGAAADSRRAGAAARRHAARSFWTRRPGRRVPWSPQCEARTLSCWSRNPQPFGLHDLRLAVEMLRQLQVPFGVVVNRVGIGDDRVHVFCAAEGIAILGEIPDDRRIAEAYCRGERLIDALPEYRGLLLALRGPRHRDAETGGSMNIMPTL